MSEQRRRMTYEEQRALRQREREHASGDAADGGRERTADRFSIESYGTSRASGATQRQRQSAQAAASRRQAQRARQGRQRQASANAGADGRGTTRQNASGRSASERSASQPTHAGAGAGASRQASRGSGATTARERLSRDNYATTASRPPLFKIALAAVLVVIVVLAVRLCTAVLPINVTVNGTEYELRGAKNMQVALEVSGLPINPGDLISLNGNVLEKSAGEPFLATVNGEETADPSFGLRDGDVVNVTDGNDIVEDYTSTEESIPFESSIVGWGSIHVLTAGQEGTLETRTGTISGETVQKQTTDPVNAMCTEYNPNVGNKKLVALTFDDGPSSEYTATVLDILKQNDVKATFFVIGTEVEAYPELVQRAYDEGHLICTHTYDHADPVGGTNIGFMDAAGQVDEIEHGRQTIADALGIEVSRLVRLPGGNLDEAMVMNLQPYIEAEFGWNIDTEDWTLPGADAIYNAIMQTTPGDIILCHDGGGDRSETVEAIRRAIPELKAKGYEFVTVDELLEYPASAG